MVELAYTSDLKSDAERLRVRVPPFAPKITSPADWYFLVYIGRDSKPRNESPSGAFIGAWVALSRRSVVRRTSCKRAKRRVPPLISKANERKGLEAP